MAPSASCLVLSDAAQCGWTAATNLSPTKGHPGCFSVWAVVGEAAVRMVCGFLHRLKFSAPLGKDHAAQLLDRVVTVCSVL